MEEAHKAVLREKRVHDDKIIPVHDEIRDHNTTKLLELPGFLTNFLSISHFGYLVH